MFRDDHARLNFQTRDDRRLQAFRRRLHFLHHAVNAVAQTKFFLQRFEVNVRRAQLKCVYDNLIHQADERGIRLDFAHFINLRDVDIFFCQLLHDIFEDAFVHGFFFAAVILRERRLDVRLRRDAQFDFRIQQMRQRINRVEIRRVGNGHGHFAFIFENGNDAIFFGDVARDDGDDVVINLHVREVNNFRAELRGLRLRHVAGANDFVGDQ